MRFSLIFILTLISNAALSQNAMKFHHKLSQSILDRDGFEIRSNDGKDKLMKIGSKRLKCVVTSDGKGTITADFWQILDTPQATRPDIFKNSDTFLNSKTSTTKFILTDNRRSLGEATLVLKRVPFSAWTFSIGTTPLRFRAKTDSSNSTVSSSLGLSLAFFNYTFGHSYITSRSANHYSLTVGPFIGISTAELKKETVTIPKIWENGKMVARINPALSYGLNVAFARNNFGFVVSGGIDHALGDMADSWSYQDKFWWGLGVNTNLGILK